MICIIVFSLLFRNNLFWYLLVLSGIKLQTGWQAVPMELHWLWLCWAALPCGLPCLVSVSFLGNQKNKVEPCLPQPEWLDCTCLCLSQTVPPMIFLARQPLCTVFGFLGGGKVCPRVINLPLDQQDRQFFVSVGMLTKLMAAPHLPGGEQEVFISCLMAAGLGGARRGAGLPETCTWAVGWANVFWDCVSPCSVAQTTLPSQAPLSGRIMRVCHSTILVHHTGVL